MSHQPLTGLNVLDLTDGVSGPFCTKLLADFGAEVIKVERPCVGDWTRHRRPFFRDEPDPEQSLLFAYLNTNKRSVTLDLNHDFGRQVIGKLCQSADILVENFAPSYLHESKLDLAELRESHPSLVVTSIPMFDRRGPYAHYKATELNLYAMSGLMSMVGGVGRSPLKAGGYQAQYMAGLQACTATLFAAYSAQNTGEGCWIEMSVIETCAKILEHTVDHTVEGARSESPEDRREHGNSVLACGEGHATATFYYFQMHGLAELLQKPSIATDPRFGSEDTLTENASDIRAELTQWLLSRTSEDVQTQGQKHGLLFTKVNNVRDLLESPHFRARNFFVEVQHPVMGRAEYPGPPFRLKGLEFTSLKAAPRLGEANEMVLCERLGYDRTHVDSLRKAGAI